MKKLFEEIYIYMIIFDKLFENKYIGLIIREIEIKITMR